MKKYFRIAGLEAILLCLILVLAACGADKTSQSGGATQNKGNAQNEPSINLGEDLKWPKDLMGNLPEPKGKITAVIRDEATKQCTVTFVEMSKEEAGAYAKKIEELGYAGGLKVAADDLISANGEDTTGARVDFLYNVSPKEGVISFRHKDTAKDSNPGAGGTSSARPVDMTDLAAWPSEYMIGIPELEGKIIDVQKNGESVSVDLEYVEKADFENYVKQLKENGYTQDIDETGSLSAIDFRAYNESGDWVHAYWTSGEDKNLASVIMEKVK